MELSHIHLFFRKKNRGYSIIISRLKVFLVSFLMHPSMINKKSGVNHFKVKKKVKIKNFLNDLAIFINWYKLDYNSGLQKSLISRSCCILYFILINLFITYCLNVC